MICGSVGSKSRLARAAGEEPRVEGRHEKLHAAVARSAFATQNVKRTDGPGPLFEVGMWKIGTPLWREAHLQVKMYKTHQLRSTF